MPPHPSLNAPTAPNPYPHHPERSQNNPNGLPPVNRTESLYPSQPLTEAQQREVQNIRQLPPGTIVFTCGDPSAAPTLNQPSRINRLLSLLRGQPKQP